MRFLGFLIIGAGIIAAMLALADYGRQNAVTPVPETVTPEEATGSKAPEQPSSNATTNAEPAGPASQSIEGIPSEGIAVELPPVRDVTPKSMTQGPRVTGLTTRLPGPPPPVPKPRKRRFFRVIVADAGTIKAKKITIKLAGVKAPDIKKVCIDAKKRKWRCGLAARGALRRLIRVRAVVCPSMPAAATATITARCTVGRTDLATWLVAQGWGEPEDGDASEELAKLLEEAKNAKRGMWR